MNNKHTMNNKHEVTVTSAPAAYRVWPSGGNAWILTHDAAFVDFARLHKWEVVELFDKRQLLLVDGLPEPRIAELAEATLWLASRSLDGRIED
jgi:hypothetical protein